MCGVGESSPAFGNVPYPLIFDSIAKNDTTTKVIMSLTKHMKITKGKKRRRSTYTYSYEWDLTPINNKHNFPLTFEEQA